MASKGTLILQMKNHPSRIIHQRLPISCALGILILIFLQGCGSSEASEGELRNYLQDPDNGLIKTAEDGSFKIEALYRPTDFILKQQMEKGSAQEIDSLRKAYGNYVYFLLSITKNDKDLETYFAYDLSSFANKISYLSDGFSASIRLEGEGRERAIADYVYTRSYGNGPSRFLLVFEKPTAKDFDLIIEGYELGFGKVRLSFNLHDINKTPNLKF